MSENKKALILGITGQDGSYLAEFLISKGYEVHGVVRRTSTFNRQRIDHIFHQDFNHPDKLILHYGDMADATSLISAIQKIQPDEIYNLAAQSHVKVSFEIPEYTADSDALGPLRIVEAVRLLGMEKKVKIYQASTSELFGKAVEIPQTENTPFYPRSPYAAAKLYAYWITKNYREAYDIFASNGILFNHETITSFMPMFYKKREEKEFDLKPISEIVEFNQLEKKYQSKKVSDIQVWGKDNWVDVAFASAYPHDVINDNKKPRFINSRSGAFMATSSHVAFMEGSIEKKVSDINIGDNMEIINLPDPSFVNNKITISFEGAELMGMMVGDGSITYAEKGIAIHGKFTNSSIDIRKRFDDLWSKVTKGNTVYYPSRSGFNPKKIVGQLRLVGGNNWLRTLDIYNKDRTKRIPKVILNSSTDIMMAFLRGYNATDGLKANPCTYEFKNFKTNSATLAMGLWYLVERTTHQNINLTVETKEDGRLFYSLNILSPVDNILKEEMVKELVLESVSQRGISDLSGISRTFIRKIQNGGHACLENHLKKDATEVKKIIDLPNYEGWFYDLETSSGEFHCGVGKCHVHNSPRRGETFVTRKITLGIAKIKAGSDQKIYLGNIEAQRDWGFAPEYVESMWKILQQEKADDFVIGTGETHSVKEFLQEAFSYVGLNWQDYVQVDSSYLRPTEVDVLISNPVKAKEKLGWEPKIKFKELVRIMVDADMRALGLTPPGEGDKILAEKFPNKWWKDGNEPVLQNNSLHNGKEKVLVTGAGGFIGHHLVRFLRRKGYWVRGVDIKYPEFSPKNEADEFLILDLRDFENCKKAVAGIDKVYNLAADMGGIGFITAVKADLVRNNILINTNMAEAAKLAKIKRLFFSSSACIYPKYKQGDANVTPLKESDAYPADCEDGYGWEKLISERMYKNFQEDHGLDVRIARFHNIFGREGTYDGGREKAPAALCRKIAMAKDGDEVEVWGDGKQTRSFCYVDDCVEAIYRLMESNFSDPLNIGSSELVSVDGMFDMIQKISGKQLNKKHLLDKPQGVRGRNSDNTLCKQVLNWETDISLEEGLKRTYEWVKSQVKAN